MKKEEEKKLIETVSESLGFKTDYDKYSDYFKISFRTPDGYDFGFELYGNGGYIASLYDIIEHLDSDETELTWLDDSADATCKTENAFEDLESILAELNEFRTALENFQAA